MVVIKTLLQNQQIGILLDLKRMNWSLEQTLNLTEVDNELCLVILSGKADITVEDDTFYNLGDRMSVFEDKKPHALYVPNNQ